MLVLYITEQKREYNFIIDLPGSTISQTKNWAAIILNVYFNKFETDPYLLTS